MNDWQKPEQAKANNCFSCGSAPNESEANGLWLIVCENAFDCDNVLCGVGKRREQAVSNWNFMNHQHMADIAGKKI